MNQTFCFTEPIERPISRAIGFNLRLTDLILGTSVRICVTINYLTGNLHSSEYKEFLVEGDEYLAWGSDDNYITELVKSKLLTLITNQGEPPFQLLE
jgi:hypothetical protein